MPYLVPLPLGIWLWLAFPRPEPPLPVSGVLPGHALRDDYDRPAPHPLHLFWIDREVFRHTLARLPAVRSRWFREVLDRVTDRANDGLF
ncbi:hypothetical protein [Streptomyces sp. SGAir0957]